MTKKETFNINGEKAHATNESKKCTVNGIEFNSVAEAIFYTATMPKADKNKNNNDGFIYRKAAKE